MRKADAVVVGAGPNGSSPRCACPRRSGGRRLRGGRRAGGGCRTAELTVPGFRHDICSAVHPLLVASPAFADIDLSAHGVRMLTPSVAFAHPLDGGRAVCVGSQRRRGEPVARVHGTGLRAHLLAARPGQSTRSCPPSWAPCGRSRPSPGGRRRSAAGSRSARRLAARFHTEEARALVAGTAAHSMLPTDGTPLGRLPRGSSPRWPTATAGRSSRAAARPSSTPGDRAHVARRGRIETGRLVKRLAELPPARAVVLDVTPRQLARHGRRRGPRRLRQGALALRYRYGPGVCKVDWALERAGAVERGRRCRRTVTVHVGGTFEEVARGEAGREGRPAPRAPVLPGDPTRASSIRTGHRRARTRCGPTATSPTAPTWT